jgi:hypothetical protein
MIENLLKKDNYYRISENEVILTQCDRSPNASISDFVWVVAKGDSLPLKVDRKITEDEALELIMKNYHAVCDSKDYGYEFNYVYDLSTPDDVQHLIDAITKDLKDLV